jgi:hypothetical protein
MKAIRGLMLLGFMFGVASCFNPPEYPIAPEIEFDGVTFIETSDPSDADTLALRLLFKDGDGDIGLGDADLIVSANTRQYAQHFYFKTDGNKVVTSNNAELANNPAFISYKTKRTVAKFDTLPRFIKPYSCTNWEIVKKTVNNATVPVDTLYFQLNPNYYNIFVDFLVKQPDGKWLEYDFRKEFCTTYDGQIPILSKDLSQPTPLEGVIRYAMPGAGFKLNFSLKTIKLRMQIQDRALHKSNIVESGEFQIK